MFDTTKADQRVARKMLSRFIVIVRKPKMEAKPKLTEAQRFFLAQIDLSGGKGYARPVSLGRGPVARAATLGWNNTASSLERRGLIVVADGVARRA